MLRKSLDIFKLGVFLFLLSLTVVFSSEIEVYYGIHKDKIRVVLRSSSNVPVEHKVFSLKNPYRIVVDLKKHVKIKRVSLPKGFSYKVGKHPWGVRFVLLPSEEHSFTFFSLKKPYRLVLDLKKEKPRYARNIRKPYLPKKVIVVDPGHGGKDPGAIGYRGIKEKWVNLQIARYLVYYLKKDGRFKVYMTRYGDYYVSLEDRIKIARRHKADLFISIHADAAPKGKKSARGTQIFVLSKEGARKRKRRILRNRRYALAIFRDAKNMRALPILSDIAFDITLNESRRFARLLATQLKRDMGGRQIVFKGIRSRGFRVLKTPGTITVLVEAGFITNPYEARKLVDENFQRKFAYSLYKAIVKYFYGNK